MRVVTNIFHCQLINALVRIQGTIKRTLSIIALSLHTAAGIRQSFNDPFSLRHICMDGMCGVSYDCRDVPGVGVFDRANAQEQCRLTKSTMVLSKAATSPPWLRWSISTPPLLEATEYTNLAAIVCRHYTDQSTVHHLLLTTARHFYVRQNSDLHIYLRKL
jgi:hypothetical protein